MRKKSRIKFAGFLVLILFTRCSSDTSRINFEKNSSVVKDKVIEVAAIEIKLTVFEKQIIVNGKIHAGTKTGLYFTGSGRLESVKVRNGELICKGDTIAVLENELQQINLSEAKNKLEQSIIELNYLILGHGGKENDTTSINSFVLKNLKNLSGYNQALLDLIKAKLEYSRSFLVAPFTGVIGNIIAEDENFIRSADKFCMLYDLNRMKVVFYALESEIRNIVNCQRVIVSPYAVENKFYHGRIRQINPVVDDDGLIEITAEINNPSLDLLEGMNVRISVETLIPDQLVVPKEAVVIRSGREVIFTLDNGLAKWHYINIASENENTYLISEGIKEGDSVIIKGNLSLTHNIKVEPGGEFLW